MIEYTVHFRHPRGSLRMETVEAASPVAAVKTAKAAFPAHRKGFRVVRVDHFEGSSIVIDCAR